MAIRLSQPDSINVLINNADWAWPQAVAEIFQPRGINALLADSAQQVVQLVDNNNIHLAILDKLTDDLTGLQILKMIRQHDPLLPCILLAGKIDQHLLGQALSLNAFSVVAKPVSISLLQDQIHRLFMKYYDSRVFGQLRTNRHGADLTIKRTIKRGNKKFIQWSFRKRKEQ